MAQYKKLVDKSIALLQNFNTQVPLSQLIDKYNLIQEFQKTPAPNHPSSRPNLIGLRTIISHPQLRLTMYNLPPKTVMKLHNHPLMNIVTYILDGSMKAHLFNPLTEAQNKNDLTNNENIKKTISRIGQQNIYTRTEKILKKSDIELIEGIRKPKLNNLHQFETNQNRCVFLDVIFPDYDEETRISKMYNFKEIENNSKLYLLEFTENDAEMIYI